MKCSFCYTREGAMHGAIMLCGECSALMRRTQLTPSPVSNEGAFIREQKRMMNAAWRALALAECRRWGYEPTEAQLNAMEAYMERQSKEPERCGCEQSKALQAELTALRARLARLEGGA